MRLIRGWEVHVDLEPLKKERALIAALTRGEQSAWGGIYDLHAQRLFRSVLMPRLANPTAAEDALSETFRTAIERFDSFADQGQGMLPWLSRIAANKAMDMHRASAVSGRKLLDLSNLLRPLCEGLPGADEILELRGGQNFLRTHLSESVARLNERYARVIQYRFFEEKSREECASLLEVKVGTFDVLLLRALRALKKEFEDALPPSSRRFHVES